MVFSCCAPHFRLNELESWITADILKCMKFRDDSKRRGKHKEYELRNLTLKLIWMQRLDIIKNVLQLTNTTLIS